MRIRSTCGLAAALLSCFFAIAAANAQVAPGALRGVLGGNKFDLLQQYLGTASNGDGSAPFLAVTRPMGGKAVADAADTGMAFVRTAAAGYGPSVAAQATSPQFNDLLMWTTNPNRYWGMVDQMFNDLDAHNVRLVPSFVWNPFQFPVLAGETLAVMLTNPASKSQALLKKYIGEFIGRYSTRRTILFYELTNELNLEADIDIAQACKAASPPADCAAVANFTTAQMNGFAATMTAYIRSLDHSRPISSGYALPRPAAYHLAAQPGFSAKGPDWTQDTESQFEQLLAGTHAAFDLISVHLYPGDVRWGNPAGTEYLTLDGVAAAARAAAKKVYVGEYGDSSVSPFVTSMLQRFVTDHVAYASVWVWEFYQQTTWQSTNITNKPGSSLEPGFTDAFDAALLAASGPGAWYDPGDPRVVLTSPLPCATVGGTIDLYAVASAAHPILRVSFSVDGTTVGSTSTPPYHVAYSVRGTGIHRVAATAFAGYRATASVSPVIFGSTPGVCAPAGGGGGGGG